MSLKEKINTDLISALKRGLVFDLQVLRGVNAAIKNKEIEDRGRGLDGDLSDDDVLEILKKEAKKRKEAMELYHQGGREELVEKEGKELEVIGRYLPEAMSREDIEVVVDEVLASSADKSFGAIMKAVMVKLKGQADGKEVAAVIKEKI